MNTCEIDPQQFFPKVAILLCTYNGQQFLAEQLESFTGQTHVNWKVWASDDGSQDDTLQILNAYKDKWKDARLSILLGPGKGFPSNFLSLTCNTSIKAEYYAYSDQDDIWAPEKLARALAYLTSVPPSVPALYCSRTFVVDANNNQIGTSPLFNRPPTFPNALVQNISGGNTMVFNEAARKLLRNTSENKAIISHDWWVYLVISGCGGNIFYDPIPSLRYRQHDNNQIGMNLTWAARWFRLHRLWLGHFKSWNDLHTEALKPLRRHLTIENLAILDRYEAARKSALLPRLFGLKRSGIHRQTLLGNLGLIVAAIFNKI